MRRAAVLATAFLALTSACAAPGAATANPEPTATATVAAAATGPPHPAVKPAAGDHEIHLDHAGDERRALLHAPKQFRPGRPVPLVIALHGRPSSAEELRRVTALDTTADAKGFLVAYPDARDGSWNALECCDGVDDVGFLKALVAELVKTWSVDPARVYVTGFSNGASMSYRLAVEASDIVAAIAPVSGGFYGGPADTDPGYRPRVPIPVLSVVGERDRYLNAFRAGQQRWNRNLQCVPGSPAAVGAASRTTAHCADGSEVIDYTVAGMDHQWPAREDIDANALMWDFFAAHPRAG
jgi:polyhydroxybutyrate depolymerase